MEARMEKKSLLARTWWTQKYERRVEVIDDKHRGFVFKMYDLPFSVEFDHTNAIGTGTLWNLFCKGTQIASIYFYSGDDKGTISSTDAVKEFHQGEVKNDVDSIVEASIMFVRVAIDSTKVSTKSEKPQPMTFKEAKAQLNRTAEFEGQKYEI